MMNPKTRRNILVVLMVVFVLMVAILFWYLFRPKPAPRAVVVPVVAEEPLPSAQTKPTATQIKTAKEQEERIASASLQSASKTFAERYGSYSTEANFANLTDVLPLMTKEYAAKTEAYVASATAPTDYYGVTTRVITVTVDAEDETAGTARVTLTTQREETSGNVQNVRVKYQDLVLNFAKESGEWKVSLATWE